MNVMYFIAVVLPSALDEKILAYKRLMQEKYGCKAGLKSPAHITLLPPFWTDGEQEEEIKKRLEAIASSLVSFPVATNNFSAFKPRTLFIAVRENEALCEVKRAVDHRFSEKEYKPKGGARSFHPHITIATRDLHKAAFAEAWAEVQNKIVQEEFEATGLSLLKHNGRTWDVIFTANFFRPGVSG